MRWLWVVVVLLVVPSHDAQAEAWGTKDYVAAGVPDPGQAWSGAELGKAADAIATAAAGHAERLPRYRDATSGTVFAKLIEPSREDPAAPLTARIGAHLERWLALNRLVPLYANGLGPPPREQIELFAVAVREAGAIAPLTGPFLASFPRDDPSLPTRRHGLAKFDEGAGGMLLGSLMIADNRQVPDADRLVVFRYLAETAPVLLPRLPAARQNEFRTYLSRLTAALTGDLHDAAVRVQRAIDVKR
jgi:hypothetical protein